MVAFVATALCADRAATAAPVLRPQVVEAARRFASRIVVSFRRAVPSLRLSPLLRDGQAPRSILPRLTDCGRTIGHILLSPFQFRLPPPVV